MAYLLQESQRMCSLINRLLSVLLEPQSPVLMCTQTALTFPFLNIIDIGSSLLLESLPDSVTNELLICISFSLLFFVGFFV